ncbi:50S ribosomal protein L5 [Candidatus Parcubacteria bacterium]|nr:50S ribosomal protein L5 [Candidatus Parcubacteria bacterium]
MPKNDVPEHLKEKYNKEIVPKLKEKFGYKNSLAVPRLEKVVLNVGLGSGLKEKSYLELVENNLKRISGQKPIQTKARKSIAGFKIREGMVVGMSVVLRKKRMYDFISRLVNATLPRVRDFRGLSVKSIDKKGNFNLGTKEYTVFPEIKMDEVEKLHGLQVSVSATAKNREEGLELLKLLGFPFKDK